jgi:hypothetical protein
MNYGDLISEAFRITWRNRFLWFFGFFAAGGGSSFNFNFPAGSGDGGVPGNVPGSLSGPGRWIQENLVLFFVVVGVLVLVLVLVFIALALISSGGLTDSVAALHRGEQRRFSSTWRAGLFYFWRVLGQALLFILISLGLLLVIGLPVGLGLAAVFAVTESTGLRVLFIVLVALFAILVLVAVFVALYIIGQLALRALVVGGERILGSISAGYNLFRRNIGRSLLVWVIQIALAIGIGIAALVVFLILGLVLIGPAVALFVADYTTAAIVVGVVGGLLFLIPVLVISGAIGTFNHTYWTLAYLRLMEPTPPPASTEPYLPPGPG